MQATELQTRKLTTLFIVVVDRKRKLSAITLGTFSAKKKINRQ